MKKERAKILITEDNEDLAELLANLFRKKGYFTITTKTGEEAIEKAKEQYFNVALIDIKLPGISGLEVLDMVKKRHPETAAILMTGYATLENAIAATNKGANAYITKPISFRELGKLVEKELEEQKIKAKILAARREELDELCLSIITDVLKFQDKIDNYCIYVSSTRPAKNLIEKVEARGFNMEKGLKTGNLCIVDLLSTILEYPKAAGSILYVPSPSDLSAIQMAIEKALEGKNVEEGKGWLILDSMVTLLVFNSIATLLEFIRFLTSKAKTLGFSCLIL